MPDLICPYSAPLAQKNNYSCPNADEVIRRGGSEYVCLQPESYAVCSEMHDKVKQAYLEDQDLQDDLLSLPHSIFVKIQFGCILGLQTALGRDMTTSEDIGSLIAEAVSHFANMKDFPFEITNAKIAAYKPQRRGKRGR